MRTKTSKYKGVSKSRKKWRASSVTIGFSKCFNTELEAAEFYNLCSKKPNQLSKEYICTECGRSKSKSEFPSDNRKIFILKNT